MSHLLQLAKQQQLAELQELTQALRDFNDYPPARTLVFTPADYRSAAGVEALSAELRRLLGPTGAKAKCLYALQTSNGKLVKAAYERFAAEVRAADPDDKRTNPYSISKFHKHRTSDCLYVGSSAAKNFDARFKRHCDFYSGKSRTFGLKLNKWLRDEAIMLTLDVWLFDILDQSVLQLVEDGLWEQLQPMFGRRGKA